MQNINFPQFSKTPKFPEQTDMILSSAEVMNKLLTQQKMNLPLLSNVMINLISFEFLTVGQISLNQDGHISLSSDKQKVS